MTPLELLQATEIRRLEARISELEAARIAYASEFPPDAEGHPDVGNIHANIRKLKAKIAPLDFTCHGETLHQWDTVYVGDGMYRSRCIICQKWGDSCG